MRGYRRSSDSRIWRTPSRFSITSLFQIRISAIAEGRQIAIALPIRGAVGVLATVDLDNQPPLTTSKVGVVRPDWFLPDEFESIELPIAKL